MYYLVIRTVLQVALKLVPDHKTFVNALKGRDDQTLDSLKEEMQTLIAILVPFLEEIHSCLVFYSFKLNIYATSFNSFTILLTDYIYIQCISFQQAHGVDRLKST